MVTGLIDDTSNFDDIDASVDSEIYMDLKQKITSTTLGILAHTQLMKTDGISIVLAYVYDLIVVVSKVKKRLWQILWYNRRVRGDSKF